MLPDRRLREYYSRLHRRRLPGGTIWFSYFAHFNRRKRAQLVRAREFPVVSLHLAAMAVQAVVRGYALRLLVAGAAPTSAQNRVPLACRRAAAAAAARRHGRPALAGSTPTPGAAAGAHARSTELSLVSRYLEAKMRRGNDIAAFNDWILLRLQAWARMVPWRSYQRALNSRILQTGAASVQRWWRAHRVETGGRRRPRKPKGPPTAPQAAVRIQHCWRGFTNRRIFAYLREMLLFREQGDAKELLRCINPREAGLIDAATAIHVRFRLGGALFPPAIYYKVYTHAPITDVGAFAPRDYKAHYQPPPIVLHNHARPGDGRAELIAAAMSHDGWYRRYENNGWRPVAGDALSDLETTARTSKPVVWHHDKQVRVAELNRRRKEKKRAWMREMYAMGKSGGATADGMHPGELGDDPEDDDLDALLQCASVPTRPRAHPACHLAGWVDAACPGSVCLDRPLSSRAHHPPHPQPRALTIRPYSTASPVRVALGLRQVERFARLRRLPR